jgi:PAS domain S-box-containing protein
MGLEEQIAVRGAEEAGLAFDLERDLLCTSDAEGRFTFLNAAWERVLGWSREELMSRPSIEFVHPEDVERTRDAAAEVDRVDHEITDFENRYRTKSGDWRWLRWSARSDGESWFAVAFDVTDRRETEHRLRETLTEERLLVYAQPIVDLRSRRVVQEELLVRLGNPDDSSVLLPAEFLPEAEAFGMIGMVDRVMTAHGVRLASEGRNVEVNLSSHSITDRALMDEITDMVRASGLSARRLIFEITETAALTNLDAASEVAERLTQLGCRFALDDFGTGFGSLAHLRKLPVHLLKIDLSFVMAMRESAEDRALVRGIAAIAKELGLETVAEGVEDAVTYRLLRDYGIDRLQGFMIGRPVPIALPRNGARV